MQRVRPPLAEQLAQMLVMLRHHILPKIRNLLRPLRRGKVENERTRHDGQFKNQQGWNDIYQSRDIVSANDPNILIQKQ